ncbi:capsule biosynthesis GfcC D2 domain-containing protein [Marinomonas sp. GJ51-6]|uniref:capsule biosynthesis GfcC D2 domain-containing protein n=1 Tax=Marinomonas sp. GJ51-6 TaxID=2992802 RepID=UPI0029346FDA|nr:capsule biosynthesis GfcC D2 domain-containing protein [Marinomonas sp. GJ51-6]WOD06139.1 capsule biosynthesis GfcC D2 domain-containing protein [Marinomonas sp. GJ51-6]
MQSTQATPSTADLETTKITLPKQKIILTYNQEVRFSRVFSDAYSHTKEKIYPLGVSLVSPEKQHLVEQKKELILTKLKDLNRLETKNLITQLSELNFVYREKIEPDINKVKLINRSNPILRGSYHFILPTRPNHLTVFNGDYERSLKLPLQTGYHLKNYLFDLPTLEEINTDQVSRKKLIYHSVWIIQPNQDIYLAEDIQWEETLYFLSPGAYIFTGVADLPKKYRDLNYDIAHLLSYYLEL